MDPIECCTRLGLRLRTIRFRIRIRIRIRFPKVMLLIDVFAVFCAALFVRCFDFFVVCFLFFFSVFCFLFSVCVFPIESNFCTWLLNRNQTATVDITTIRLQLRLQVDGARSKVYKPYTATRSPVAADSNGPC